MGGQFVDALDVVVEPFKKLSVVAYGHAVETSEHLEKEHLVLRQGVEVFIEALHDLVDDLGNHPFPYSVQLHYAQSLNFLWDKLPPKWSKSILRTHLTYDKPQKLRSG